MEDGGYVFSVISMFSVETLALEEDHDVQQLDYNEDTLQESNILVLKNGGSSESYSLPMSRPTHLEFSTSNTLVQKK